MIFVGAYLIFDEQLKLSTWKKISLPLPSIHNNIDLWIHLDSVWEVLPQAPPVALTPQTRIQWIPHRGRFHLSSWWCRCVKASRWRDQITGTTTSCLKACSPWRLITRMTTYSRRHSESPLSFTWLPNHEFLIIFSLMMVESLWLSPCFTAPLPRSI